MHVYSSLTCTIAIHVYSTGIAKLGSVDHHQPPVRCAQGRCAAVDPRVRVAMTVTGVIVAVRESARLNFSPQLFAVVWTCVSCLCLSISLSLEL